MRASVGAGAHQPHERRALQVEQLLLAHHVDDVGGAAGQHLGQRVGDDQIVRGGDAAAEEARAPPR